jgi:hypothetical protein
MATGALRISAPGRGELEAEAVAFLRDSLPAHGRGELEPVWPPRGWPAHPPRREPPTSTAQATVLSPTGPALWASEEWAEKAGPQPPRARGLRGDNAMKELQGGRKRPAPSASIGTPSAWEGGWRTRVKLPKLLAYCPAGVGILWPRVRFAGAGEAEGG